MLDTPKLRTAIALWADDLGLDLSNLDGDMLIDRIRSALVATPPAELVVETDWINYRPLAEGEIIQDGDECLTDSHLGWQPAANTVGSAAPDPSYTAHRMYRRPLATKPAVKDDETVVALPPTREYVDRIVRIFRDRPADDTSAVVLQDYARAMLAASPAAPQQGGE